MAYAGFGRRVMMAFRTGVPGHGTSCGRTAVPSQPCSVGRRGHLAAVIAVAAGVFGAACGTTRPNPTPDSPSPAATGISITGSFPVAAGRSMAIDCGGTGSVTVLLEVGFDAAGTSGEWRMQALRQRLLHRYRVCNYDRANLGRSDPAPKPRTTGDIADDLAALLTAAKVPGPYLLVGVSAGGLYVQHFAARHPDQVVAVLAMNPELRADRFNARAFPLLTPQERADELAHQSGGNGQGIDYATSATQINADGPLRSPLTIMESVNQCEDQHPTCLKVAKIIPGIGRELVAAAAPGGKYVQVHASHNLYLEVPDEVLAEIDRLAALPR
jgi:pimeloyl-ACP methyl ester carboxylesterase